MCKVSIKEFIPGSLNSKDIQAVGRFIQTRLNVSDSNVVQSIMNKDKIYLCYNSESKTIIGVIGIKIVDCGEFVIVYYGTTIIDKNHQHTHLLPYVAQAQMKYLYVKYPFKKKYHVALISSAGSFKYFMSVKPVWPNKTKEVPPDVGQDMEKIIRTLGSTYRIDNRRIISTELCSDVGPEGLHKNTKPDNDPIFEKLNPGYMRGEQLLVIAEFRSSQLLYFMTQTYHNSIIKRKKIYRYVKRNRIKAPLKSLALFMFGLYKNQFISTLFIIGGLSLALSVYD